MQFMIGSDVYRCSLVSAACSNVVALNMLTAVESSTQSTVRTVWKFSNRACLRCGMFEALLLFSLLLSQRSSASLHYFSVFFDN